MSDSRRWMPARTFVATSRAWRPARRVVDPQASSLGTECAFDTRRPCAANAHQGHAPSRNLSSRGRARPWARKEHLVWHLAIEHNPAGCPFSSQVPQVRSRRRCGGSAAVRGAVPPRVASSCRGPSASPRPGPRRGDGLLRACVENCAGRSYI